MTAYKLVVLVLVLLVPISTVRTLSFSMPSLVKIQTYAKLVVGACEEEKKKNQNLEEIWAYIACRSGGLNER